MKFKKRLEYLEQLQTAKLYEPLMIITIFVEPSENGAATGRCSGTS
jgi:hypothetical protein